MKLSHHSKLRMSQRANIPKHEQKAFFRRVLDYGKSAEEIENEKIKQYLLSKEYKGKAKLYKGYVFIYSKNSKHLFTMFKLPEKYQKEKEVQLCK